jgi:hypothetical protein
MMKFIKKIFKRFIIIITFNNKTNIRQKENILLRKANKSDIKRWQKNNELFQDWDQRTLILGSYIIPNSNILEFGAGNMILKSSLTSYKSYTPSDIVPRFDDTVVCDLNQNIPFELSKYDAVVFSGVLEYVYNIDKVILQMSTKVNQIVLSYCCADLVKLSRDKNGWLSDYSKKELEEIFLKYGYEIKNYQEWRNQSLYNLVKKNNK